MTGRIPRQTEKGFLEHPLTVALIAGSAFGLLGFVTGTGTQTEKVAQIERSISELKQDVKELRYLVQQQAVDLADAKARIGGSDT